MARLTHFQRSALFIAVPAALAACAVTKVDVDVYKGPLANHKDVQVQQFAIMAVGAKPLLVQLRDLLQWKTLGERVQARDNPLYVSGHIPRLSKAAKEFLSVEDAIRVNAVLSLYDDTAPKGLESYLRDATTARANYLAALRILEPDRAEAAARWLRFKAAFMTSAEFALKFELTAPLPAGTDSAGNVFEMFRDEYQEILDPESASGDLRRTRDIFDKYIDLLEEIKKLNSSFERVSGLNLNVESKHAKDVDGRGSNARWEELSKRDVVATHAKLLFRNPTGAEAREFVDGVVSIAASFDSAREAIRELWTLSLTALDTLDTIDSAELDDQSKVKLSSLIAHLSAFLSQPLYLALAIVEPRADPALSTDLKARISKFLPDGPLASIWTMCRSKFKSKEYKTATRAIRLALLEDPIQTTELLRMADSHFKSDKMFVDDDQACPGAAKDSERDELKSDEKRRFGIVRGPTFKKKDIRIEDLTTSVLTGSALGFERGRLPLGLETLMESYLRERDQIPADETRVTSARDRLLDALVRFAQKVLALANNDVLISDSSGDRGRYVQVLQAVGNSMLVQADELRFRATHKRKLGDGAEAELEALRAAASVSPPDVIDDLLDGLRDDSRRAGERVQAASTALAAATQSREDADSVLFDAETKQRQLQGEWDEKNRAKEMASLEVKPILDAFKTLILPDPDPNAPGRGSDVQIAIEVAELVDSVTQKTVVQRIAKWIDDEIKATENTGVEDSPDIKKYESALGYFGKLKDNVNATVLGQRDDVFDGIKDLVDNAHTSAEGKISAAEEVLESATSALKAAKAEVEAITQRQQAAQKVEDDATTQCDMAQEEKTRFDHAATALAAIRGEILIKVAPLRGAATAQNVVQLARSTLAEKLEVAKQQKVTADAGTDENAKKQAAAEITKLTDAVEVIGGREPTVDAGRIADRALGEGETTKDVLDRLIALLRYEHVLAVEQAGASDGEAPKIAAALKAAYDHRSGMAYIRPSAAYLRSSYPSTSLQADPALGWQNMLARHSLRSLPFVSEKIVGSSDEERLRIVSEIDKQFWQNINSVRVGGAGRTNYVIAKDDIGNWYVKNYSADTEPIIKAAKSLALFGMGGQMGTNLLGSQDDQAGGAAPASGGAPLERLFEKHREKYTTRTEKDYADLVAMIEGKGIAARIEQAVESRAGDLGTVKVQVDQALARSQGVLELDLKDSKKADAETRTGTKIVRVLNSVKSFHTGLKGEIAELKPADDAQKAALEGVTRDVTTIVRGILNDMIARRRDAVQDYESSVIFIGDATKG